MEVLKTPKTEYILEAGLDVLHQQSNEWLEEIAFWRDEVSFFYSLFVKKTVISVPVSSKSKIDKIENELTKLTSEDLNKLEAEVKEHEHYLAQLMLKNRLNERDYREKHEELTMKFSDFENRIKALKKTLFSVVEEIDRR